MCFPMCVSDAPQVVLTGKQLFDDWVGGSSQSTEAE